MSAVCSLWCAVRNRKMAAAVGAVENAPENIEADLHAKMHGLRTEFAELQAMLRAQGPL